MATEILRPNGAGSLTDIPWQYPDSTYHWDKVDEASADEDGTYVWHDNTYGSVMVGDLYALPDSGIGVGTINSVTIYVRGRGLYGVNYEWIQTYIKTGGTAYTGTQEQISGTSYQDWSTAYTTNPQAGGAWTWAQINALEAGVRICDSAGAPRGVRCTQVWVVVDYTVVAPTVTTQAATDVAATSCTGNGNITATGGVNCSRRGFCYMVGTSGDPTTANSVAYDDGDFGTGAYTKAITGLSSGTGYRVRAYAVNSAGTGYGATVQVTTTATEIIAVVITATAEALVPTLSYDYIFDVVVATATAELPIPGVGIGIEIEAVVSTATAEALVPTLSYDYIFDVVVATATAEALVPTIAYDYIIIAVPATATAEVLTPTLSLDYVITAVVATADAALLIPTIEVIFGAVLTILANSYRQLNLISESYRQLTLKEE